MSNKTKQPSLKTVFKKALTIYSHNLSTPCQKAFSGPDKMKTRSQNRVRLTSSYGKRQEHQDRKRRIKRSLSYHRSHYHLLTLNTVIMVMIYVIDFFMHRQGTHMPCCLLGKYPAHFIYICIIQYTPGALIKQQKYEKVAWYYHIFWTPLSFNFWYLIVLCEYHGTV